MAAVVEDEVWQQLHPSTGRLRRRAQRRLAVGIVAAIIALVLGAYVRTSGLVTPRVTIGPGWDAAYEYADGSDEPIFYDDAAPTIRVRQQVHVANEGSFAVTIVGADHDRLGMLLASVTVGDIHQVGNSVRLGGRPLTPEEPYRLEPGQSVSIQLHYDVTDCHSVSAETETVRLRLIGPLGPRTVELTVRPLNPSDGGWGITDPSDPDAVPWQRYLADRVCALNG